MGPSPSLRARVHYLGVCPADGGIGIAVHLVSFAKLSWVAKKVRGLLGLDDWFGKVRFGLSPCSFLVFSEYGVEP